MSKKLITVEELQAEFEKNGFRETEVICPDGTKAVVVPCVFYLKEGEKPTMKNCEYFLIYWDMPWGGASNIYGLVNALNCHEQLFEEAEEDKRQLKAYFNTHHGAWDDESWSFYSDWHKDVYGYRPRAR